MRCCLLQEMNSVWETRHSLSWPAWLETTCWAIPPRFPANLIRGVPEMLSVPLPDRASTTSTFPPSLPSPLQLAVCREKCHIASYLQSSLYQEVIALERASCVNPSIAPYADGSIQSQWLRSTRVSSLLTSPWQGQAGAFHSPLNTLQLSLILRTRLKSTSVAPHLRLSLRRAPGLPAPTSSTYRGVTQGTLWWPSSASALVYPYTLFDGVALPGYTSSQEGSLGPFWRWVYASGVLCDGNSGIDKCGSNVAARCQSPLQAVKPKRLQYVVVDIVVNDNHQVNRSIDYSVAWYTGSAPWRWQWSELLCFSFRTTVCYMEAARPDTNI